MGGGSSVLRLHAKYKATQTDINIRSNTKCCDDGCKVTNLDCHEPIRDRVVCLCSEKKRSKTHKRLKQTLFNWTKQDKTCEFLRKSSFSKLHTTKKQKNKQSVHLAYVSLMHQAHYKKGHD